MFGLQPTHIVIIVVVALLIFGPARLPSAGRAIGKTIREFQSGIKESAQGLRDEVVAKPAEARKEEPPKAA